MSAGQLLRVRGVSKSFASVHALHEVDFAIDAGQIVCLAGENGSGKSTLVKIIAGVVTPDAGAIEVDGRARPAWPPIDAVRAGFEVIYQDFSCFLISRLRRTSRSTASSRRAGASCAGGRCVAPPKRD